MKVSLVKVRLNGQGYDSNGSYWGVGLPLYRYEFINTSVDNTTYTDHIRAQTREHAKLIVRSKHENARFYN